MVEQVTDTLAARLKLLRSYTNLKQTHVARVAGVSQQLVSLLELGERGTKRPSYDHISRIASVFGVRPAWLVSGTGPKPSAKRVRAAVERAVAAASATEAAQ